MVPGYITPCFISTLMLTITNTVFVAMTCFAGKSHLYPMTRLHKCPLFPTSHSQESTSPKKCPRGTD